MPDGPPQIDDDSGSPPRIGVRALARYAAGWLAVSLAAASGAVLLIGAREDEVSLPPVRLTSLTEAARAAGCELRAGWGDEALRPAVTGPPAPAARPAVYTRAPDPATLVGALRRGIIVIHHRPALPDEEIDQLARLQRAAPAGTIVTPNADMPYAVAVTAWRRMLSCRTFQNRTMNAVQSFHGRYLGTGPDS